MMRAVVWTLGALCAFFAGTSSAQETVYCTDHLIEGTYEGSDITYNFLAYPNTTHVIRTCGYADWDTKLTVGSGLYENDNMGTDCPSNPAASEVAFLTNLQVEDTISLTIGAGVGHNGSTGLSYTFEILCRPTQNTAPATTAKFAEAAPAVNTSLVSCVDSQWYYDGARTCVGCGDWPDECPIDDLFCAGDSGTFGYTIEQAAAVNISLGELDNRHPNCPVIAQQTVFCDQIYSGTYKGSDITYSFLAYPNTTHVIRTCGYADWDTKLTVGSGLYENDNIGTDCLSNPAASEVAFLTNLQVADTFSLTIGAGAGHDGTTFLDYSFEILCSPTQNKAPETTAKFASVAPLVNTSLVSCVDSQWYYDGARTCVGCGDWPDACPIDDLFCAGDINNFGYTIEQAAAVNISLEQLDGRHPSCPAPARETVYCDQIYSGTFKGSDITYDFLAYPNTTHVIRTCGYADWDTKLSVGSVLVENDDMGVDCFSNAAASEVAFLTNLQVADTFPLTIGAGAGHDGSTFLDYSFEIHCSPTQNKSPYTTAEFAEGAPSVNTSLLSCVDSVWYYDGARTCVGCGDWPDSCPTFNLFCAGDNDNFGFTVEQAAAVEIALGEDDNRHPEARGACLAITRKTIFCDQVIEGTYEGSDIIYDFLAYPNTTHVIRTCGYTDWDTKLTVGADLYENDDIGEDCLSNPAASEVGFVSNLEMPDTLAVTFGAGAGHDGSTGLDFAFKILCRPTQNIAPATTAKFAEAAPTVNTSLLSCIDSQWYYDGARTCVGCGDWPDTCPIFNLFCAGNSDNFGYTIQQAAAVETALGELDNRHPCGSGPGMCQDARNPVTDGCNGVDVEVDDECLPLWRKAAIRCCSFEPESNGCWSFCGGVDHMLADYFTAVETCEENGLRLCTRAEIDADNCCNTGCEFDSHQTWIFESCDLP